MLHSWQRVARSAVPNRTRGYFALLHLERNRAGQPLSSWPFPQEAIGARGGAACSTVALRTTCGIALRAPCCTQVVRSSAGSAIGALRPGRRLPRLRRILMPSRLLRHRFTRPLLACAATMLLLASSLAALVVFRSTPWQAQAATRILPAGMPGHFSFGVMNGPGSVRYLNAMRAHNGTAWDFRYTYLAGGANTGKGWSTWDAPAGQYATNY